MRDVWNTNSVGVRALTQGRRRVFAGSIMIDGQAFRGNCLEEFEGQWVRVACCDVYGVEYAIADNDGRRIGVVCPSRR